MATTSNSAPTNDTVTSFPPKVCKMLTGLATARKTAKDRLNTLIGRRKDIDEELNHLGAGHTKAHLEMRSDLVICLRGIDWQRARIKTLSDKIEELLIEPTQDWLWEDLPDTQRHDPDESLLFGGGAGGLGDDDEAPVGEHPTFADAEEERDAPEAETDADENDRAVERMLPGVFVDQNGRSLPIGDREALEEVINNAIGSVWHWEVSSSGVYGNALHVRKEPGSASPVTFSLRRIGDIEESKPARKPVAKKNAGAKARKKKTAKKAVGK